MKRFPFVFILMIYGFNAMAQEPSFNDYKLLAFNPIIKELEAKYQKSKASKFRSIPQANGVNFQVKTKQGNKFLADLKLVNKVEELKGEVSCFNFE